MTVVNGDLSFARFPVIVGHYVGDSIAGSEAELDAALDGAIRRRYALGVYPGTVGTATVAQHPTRPDRMGVVVGLGDMAMFNVGAVRAAIISGLLELALKGVASGVALVMLGARAGLIPTIEILSAMLSGITEAQRRLDDQGLPRFADVQLIAQMEDSAHLVWHNLMRLTAQPRFAATVALHPEIEFSLGATRRITKLTDTDAWRVIQVNQVTLGDGSHGLHFAAIGGQARAEGYLTPANTGMIKSLVDGAVTGQGDDSVASPARALFELVWPGELKRISHEDRNIRLILDSAAAELPFELMDDRQTVDPEVTDAAKPPAVRHGLLRQLVQGDFARVQASSGARATALVIGDPRGGPPAADFPALPGAIKEANAVADLLEASGYAVTRLIGDKVTPVDVVETLLRGGWTIIHISAHGIYDYAFRSDRLAAEKSGSTAPWPRYTGVVLGDRITLSPSVLQGLPDPPALAFINCCDLASIDPADEEQLRNLGRPEFAASFAAQLIALGASTVIAAGWTVNDSGALTFAKTLYPLLLAGDVGLGEAVRQAREAVHDADPVNTTWGAYQCYGEPDWQLRPTGGAKAPDLARTNFASHIEALATLSNLRHEAQIGSRRAARSAGIAADLAAVEAKIRTMDWITRPRVGEALGRCHATLGHVDAAIACFEEALEHDADPSTQLIETLANLEIRRAADAVAQGTLPPAAALATVASARARLLSLCAAGGDTIERLSLIGGAWKREAELVSDAARDAALGAMRDAYREAWDLARLRNVDAAYYPAELTCTAQVLLALRDGDATPADCAAQLADFASAIGESDGPDDLWRAGSRISRQLLGCLAARDYSAASRDALIAAYTELWATGGDWLQLDTTVAHLRFVRGMLRDKAIADPASWLDDIAAAVAALRPVQV